jgi:hypothetical protein
VRGRYGRRYGISRPAPKKKDKGDAASDADAAAEAAARDEQVFFKGEIY